MVRRELLEVILLAENIIAQLKENGVYSQTTLSVVLCNGLRPKGLCQAQPGGRYDGPSYFLGSDDSVIVFPPSTQQLTATEVNTMGHNSGQVLQNSEQGLDTLKNKKWVFPIAEEEADPSEPRKHWVTLHYDPQTKTAVVIDSLPNRDFFNYSTQLLPFSVEQALAEFELEVEHFEVKYQNIQWDSKHCGAWTAHNVMALANGADMQELAKGLNTPTKKVLIAEKTRLANELKHEGSYLDAAVHVDEPEDIWDIDDPSDNEDEDDREFDDEGIEAKQKPYLALSTTHRKASDHSLESAGEGTTTTEGTSDEDDDWELVQDEVDEAKEGDWELIEHASLPTGIANASPPASTAIIGGGLLAIAGFFAFKKESGLNGNKQNISDSQPYRFN